MDGRGIAVIWTAGFEAYGLPSAFAGFPDQGPWIRNAGKENYNKVVATRKAGFPF